MKNQGPDDWDYCPRCNNQVAGMAQWVDGECLYCGNTYEWDEHCLEDYSDCWASLYWDSYEPLAT